MITSKLVHFRIVGIFLIIGLLLWIAYKIYLFSAYEPPEIMSIGNAFEGNLQLPIEVVNTKINNAQEIMLSKANIGQYLQWASDVTTWLSFLATAIITLIIGASGRTLPVNPAQPTQAEMQGFSTKTVRIIGVLAALSAIFTATGNMSVSQSQIYFKKAETLRDAINYARKEIIKAPTAYDVQSVLNNLDIIIRQ